MLAIVWGASAPDARHAAATATWLGELFARLGANVEPVAVVAQGA